MKKLLIAAALAFGTLGAFAQQTRESLSINESVVMADTKFKSTDKKEVSLNDVKTKKGLIVMFSCNTCPYVIKSQERTKEVMNYAKEKGIGMVIVNSNEAKRGDEDSHNAMSKYAKGQGYKVPYIVDEKSQLADAFGATRTPEVFLFNGEGKLVYKGAMEDNPSTPAESKEMYLKNAIDKMLAGQEINPNSTKSIGCTIKRAM
jgi:thioredoxin-related protein